MKTITFIISFFISLSSFAQAKLGMNNFYTITPASATTTVGIAYNSNITIRCAVQNKGNAVFNGNINLLRSIVSGTFQGTTLLTYTTAAVTLNPGDTINLVFNDSVTTSSYRQSGNGNTVVVWPVSSAASTIDSLRTIPIYTAGPNSIHEFEKNELIIYPNPANQLLFIKPEQGVDYKEIRIYDIQMKVIMKTPFNESVDISKLPAGLYRIHVSTTKEKEYTSQFTKTD